MKLKMTFLAVAVVVVASGLYVTARSLATLRSSTPVSQTPEAASKTIDPAARNYADVDFAKKQLLYHQLGALLAEKAKNDAVNPEIRRLGAQMNLSETEKANSFARLLEKWNEPFTNITEFPETKGCHGYPTFTGMLPYTAVGTYRLSSGNVVDEQFVMLMKKHHQNSKQLEEVEGRGVGNLELISLRDASTRDYRAESSVLQTVLN